MNLAQLAMKAREHWAMWLPEKTAELKKEGMFELATQAVAVAAMKEADVLEMQGYTETAAEEVVLKQFILLPPEPGAELLDWEAEELAEKERQYQEFMTAGEAPPESR